MPLTYEECCNLLELEKKIQDNPTKKEVTKAYYNLAKKLHPDKAPAGKTIEYQGKFQKMLAAYETFLAADFDKKRFSSPQSSSTIDSAIVKKRDQAITAILNLVNASKTAEEKQLSKNISSLQGTLLRWNSMRRSFIDDDSENKVDQIAQLLKRMDIYFVYLQNCMLRDTEGKLESNSPWNKTLIETSDILVKAVEAIDKLKQSTPTFGKVSMLFDPIMNTLAAAQNSVIAPLAELKTTTDTDEVHKDALALATALLQRSNQNFNHRFNYFIAKSTATFPGDYSAYSASEMVSLGNFLEKTIDVKQNPSKANELIEEINKHQANNQSTTSLYWEKFKNSLYILLEKVIGAHKKIAASNTYFDEKIKNNNLVASLKKFGSFVKTNSNKKKDSPSSTDPSLSKKR